MDHGIHVTQRMNIERALLVNQFPDQFDMSELMHTCNILLHYTDFHYTVAPIDPKKPYGRMYATIRDGWCPPPTVDAFTGKGDVKSARDVLTDVKKPTDREQTFRAMSLSFRYGKAGIHSRELDMIFHPYVVRKQGPWQMDNDDRFRYNAEGSDWESTQTDEITDSLLRMSHIRAKVLLGAHVVHPAWVTLSQLKWDETYDWNDFEVADQLIFQRFATVMDPRFLLLVAIDKNEVSLLVNLDTELATVHTKLTSPDIEWWPLPQGKICTPFQNMPQTLPFEYMQSNAFGRGQDLKLEEFILERAARLVLHTCQQVAFVGVGNLSWAEINILYGIYEYAGTSNYIALYGNRRQSWSKAIKEGRLLGKSKNRKPGKGRKGWRDKTDVEKRRLMGKRVERAEKTQAKAAESENAAEYEEEHEDENAEEYEEEDENAEE